MDGEQYDLYFGFLKVGGVTQSHSDFPNLWGSVAYEPWLSSPRSPVEEHLVRFVALSEESSRLIEVEHEVDNSREQAVVDAEMEAKYMDLIESEEWWLVDREGREMPILCPIFSEGGLVWAWDPGRKQQGRGSPPA